MHNYYRVDLVRAVEITELLVIICFEVHNGDRKEQLNLSVIFDGTEKFFNLINKH